MLVGGHGTDARLHDDCDYGGFNIFGAGALPCFSKKFPLLIFQKPAWMRRGGGLMAGVSAAARLHFYGERQGRSPAVTRSKMARAKQQLTSALFSDRRIFSAPGNISLYARNEGDSQKKGNEGIVHNTSRKNGFGRGLQQPLVAVAQP
jgi:hypothetical protein